MAGLASARELTRIGKHALLIEARERVGGRAYTLLDPRSLVPLELGAEFIHGTPPELLALLREIGVARCDTARGRSAEISNGEIVEDEESIGDLAALARRAGELDRDVSVDEFLRRFDSDATHAAAARMMRAMVEGFDASDPADASVSAIAEEWGGTAGIGGDLSRPVGGYGPLVDHMLHSLDAGSVDKLFGAAVRRIEWSRNGVRISGNRGEEAFEIEARAAIITLPLGVLQHGDVHFDPPLPKERLDAIDLLAMGPVYKAVMVFAEPVWERAYDGRLKDVAFFHDEGAPFPTLWTSLPMRSSTLVAWAGGPRAAALAGKTEEELYECVHASVDRILGAGAREFVETIYLHDWQNDPFSCGAYSYVKVGGMGARERLAEPLEDVLFFAGEATALKGEAGTVGGALKSGVRAAREVCLLGRR